MPLGHIDDNNYRDKQWLSAPSAGRRFVYYAMYLEGCGPRGGGGGTPSVKVIVKLPRARWI